MERSQPFTIVRAALLAFLLPETRGREIGAD